MFVLEYEIYISRIRQDSADLLTDVEKSLTVQRFISLLSPKIQDPPTPLFLLLSVPGSEAWAARSPPLPRLPHRRQHLEQPGLWQPWQVAPHLNIKVSLQSDFEQIIF